MLKGERRSAVRNPNNSLALKPGNDGLAANMIGPARMCQSGVNRPMPKVLLVLPSRRNSCGKGVVFPQSTENRMNHYR